MRKLVVSLSVVLGLAAALNATVFKPSAEQIAQAQAQGGWCHQAHSPNEANAELAVGYRCHEVSDLYR